MSILTSTSSTSSTSSSFTASARPTVAGGRDVHLRALTISYSRAGLEVTPISELDMYAPSSRVTALVGRSGSGKTSILSCIAAMLRPKSGSVWVGGIKVNELHGRDLDLYRRRHVGVVHQSYNLIPSLTAVENVAVPLSLAGVGRREATERALDLLDELGLAAFGKHRPDQMSGGQQQRVAVARALAPNPSVLIADEPTAHLDGTSVADVRSMLRTIAESGRTVILSTHDDRLLSGVDQTIHLAGV
jgi:putative ABC transport system ATP-binding protein